MSRFPRWAAMHRHPHGEGISSQRSSELFASINEEARQRFSPLQGKRRIEREYLAYDSRSVSSYAKCLRQVRYGDNKDHERPEQINLALLFGQESRLPFYYRKLIHNLRTLRKLLADMSTLGYEKIKMILDRGFFSAANINDLYRHHMKEVLDEMDMIEYFEVPGQKLQLGETTKHQMDLYAKMGVTPPASLQ